MKEKNAEMEYILLRTVADAGIPVGAGYLADTLQSTGKSTLSEATIGRYLRQFEQRGYLKSEKYDGRSRGRAMSEAGLAYLRELEVSRQQAQMVQTTLELFTNSFGVQLKNVLAARQIIEPETAALAAANATSEDIARLRQIVDETAQLKSHGKSMAAKDAIFHIEVARATGNPVLEAVMRMIRADRDYSPELERMINASSVNNPSDHLNIFLAIEERKPDKARRIMKQHIHKLIVKVEGYEKKGKVEQP